MTSRLGTNRDKSAKRALRLSAPEEPLRVTLLVGIGAYRAGMREEAKSALQDAASSNEYKLQAESLLRQLDEA